MARTNGWCSTAPSPRQRLVKDGAESELSVFYVAPGKEPATLGHGDSETQCAH